MILSALIVFNLIHLINHRIPIDYEIPIFSPLTFHMPLVAVDSFAIWLLRKNPVPLLTDLLCVVISLSIINHTLGTMAWLTYNHDLRVVYDYLRSVLFGLVLLAFAWGWIDRQLNRKRHLAPVSCRPGLYIVEKNK